MAEQYRKTTVTITILSKEEPTEMVEWLTGEVVDTINDGSGSVSMCGAARSSSRTMREPEMRRALEAMDEDEGRMMFPELFEDEDEED